MSNIDAIVEHDIELKNPAEKFQSIDHTYCTECDMDFKFDDVFCPVCGERLVEVVN